MKLFAIKNKKTNQAGFTLVELIVSIGLFTVVALVGIGSLLNIVGVNKKTQSLKSVVNNINFAVESISKSIRVGTAYHCENVSGTTVPSGLDSPRDCASGGNLIAFEASGGNRSNSTDQIVYRLNGTQIERSTNGGVAFVGVTAPEVVITPSTGLRFYVLGSDEDDGLQPKIIIVLRGEVNFGEKATTDFNLQTTVSQREIDN